MINKHDHYMGCYLSAWGTSALPEKNSEHSKLEKFYSRSSPSLLATEENF